MTFAELGWDENFAKAFAPHAAKGWVPARLIRETPINYSAFVPDDNGDDETPASLARDHSVAGGGDAWSVLSRGGGPGIQPLFSADKAKQSLQDTSSMTPISS